MHTVRFSSEYHVPEHHPNLCMGMKRSAWDSDEHSQGSSKNRDRIAILPPRRPTREESDRILVVSKEYNDHDQTKTQYEPKPLPIRQMKSILKSSKFSGSNAPTHNNLTSPTRTISTISDGSCNGSSSPIIFNHRDSVLDLHELANRAEAAAAYNKRFQRQSSLVSEASGEASAICVPSVLNLIEHDDTIHDEDNDSFSSSFPSIDGSTGHLLQMALDVWKLTFWFCYALQYNPNFAIINHVTYIPQ